MAPGQAAQGALWAEQVGGLRGLTWQAAGVGLEPPGGETLSLFPEVNTCHTPIMMSVNQTEDPELESKCTDVNSPKTAHTTRR